MSRDRPAGGAVNLAEILLARPIIDRQAVLVCVEGALAAVLCRLDHEVHEDLMGHWVVEAAFGPYDLPRPPVFRTLGAAERWIAAIAATQTDSLD